MEQQNVAAQHPKVVQQMSKQLLAWRGALPVGVGQ